MTNCKRFARMLLAGYNRETPRLPSGQMGSGFRVRFWASVSVWVAVRSL